MKGKKIYKIDTLCHECGGNLYYRAAYDTVLCKKCNEVKLKNAEGYWRARRIFYDAAQKHKKAD